MRKPIKVGKRWGKRKIILTSSGNYIRRIRPGKRARSNLSMDKKKKRTKYQKAFA